MKFSNSKLHGKNGLTAFLFLASASLLACSENKTQCEAVKRDGQCLQGCEDSLCATDNVCVFPPERPEGYCSLPCEWNRDCPTGFACYTNVRSSSDTGTYCLDLALTDQGAPDVACNNDNDCDTGHGLRCFEGSCAHECSSVLSTCPAGTMCKGVPNVSANESPGYCATAHEEWLIPGRYGTDCPLGDDHCDVGAGFACVGPQGTPEANCSKPDGCSVDADCPSGFWCGATRVFDGNTLDTKQQPKTCLRREFCSPCESDVDCSHTTNGICVPDVNGERFCSIACKAEAASCVIGASCEDVGDGRTACRPDAGVCHKKNPQGCDPCRIDSDCGPNGICLQGKSGYKPGVSWCSTPCGPESEFGKNTCPLAPNGLEMVCLDENMLQLGGPFDPSTPSHIYKHCYAPITIDNTEMFPEQDPPNNDCGNFKVEDGEECDDGNNNDSDGCSNCMVTPECTFTIAEPNGDGNPVVSPVPAHINTSATEPEPHLPNVISTSICKSFKVEGAIENPGDVDVVAIMLPNGVHMWTDTYTSTVGTCTADLTTEARVWKNGEKATDESLLNLEVPCEGLSGETMNVADGQLCPGTPDHLACGSCDGPGVCGVCDKDSGVGDCSRMFINTSTKLSDYPIWYDGRYKVLRIYASDPAATVGNYVLIGSRFIAQSPFGPSTPPTISCY